jgi:hypothetical protein
MSYEAIREAIDTVLLTIPGLTVIDYEPQSVESPTMYSLLSSVRRDYSEAGHIVRITYRTRHRLLVLWRDNEAAENSITPFVDSIPAALDADPKIGAKAQDGAIVEIYGDTPGWITLGGVEYRCIDFISEITELAPIGAYGG